MRFTVMSFNIWRNGGRSLERTIEAIRAADADVVGLQECNAAAADAIAGALDLALASDDASLAIVSRHPIVLSHGRTAEAWGGMGVTLDVAGRPVHVFDAHLHWDRYGPYHLKQGKPKRFVLGEELIMRMPGLDELLATMRPLVATGAPCFLVGDFNAPSHLDYEDFPWPTSLACEAAGLADAWRSVHPDDPGLTWTPIPEEEPHGAFDRIDFVHYSRNSGVQPRSAHTLDGTNGPDPWPSDHRAVVARFELP